MGVAGQCPVLSPFLLLLSIVCSQGGVPGGISFEALGQAVQLDIGAYAGETAQVGFRYAGDGWNWWAQVDNVGVTPEPGTLALLAVGAMGVIRRRR